MAFVIKNEFISKELEKEIATAIKERRSVAQLLTEKKFVGTAESIEELAHVLILYMGADMAIEFIFSASLSEWEKYRGLLADLWEKISVSEQFKAKTDLILGQSLYQQGLKELGTNFIKRAGINADNVKTAVDVAQVISHE
ncbi:MAG: hypothetical protein LBH98_10045, partial [Chitinispirillales bacterium]|nr:hypothetical protein [Chitinispirillales bacterium]